MSFFANSFKEFILMTESSIYRMYMCYTNAGEYEYEVLYSN